MSTPETPHDFEPGYEEKPSPSEEYESAIRWGGGISIIVIALICIVGYLFSR